VVVKLAPKFGDYLHNTLIPGYHYIPSGETNLSSVLDYLFNSTNDAHLQQIVRNANEWCRYHMTHPKLLEDVLDLFNGYVELLDREDISWLAWWKDHYIEYIQPGKSDFYHEANLTTAEEEKHSRDLHPKSLML